MKYQPLKKDSQAALVTERHMALQNHLCPAWYCIPHISCTFVPACVSAPGTQASLSVVMLSPCLKILEKVNTNDNWSLHSPPKLQSLLHFIFFQILLFHFSVWRLYKQPYQVAIHFIFNTNKWGKSQLFSMVWDTVSIHHSYQSSVEAANAQDLWKSDLFLFDNLFVQGHWATDQIMF